MSNSVQCSGSVVAAPSATSDTTFPAGTDDIPFNLNPSSKPYNVSTGNVVNVNSPAAMVAIPGIGVAPGPVTQGQFLFLRTTTPMKVQKTYGATVIGPEPWSGLMIIEMDPNNPLTGLSVQGAGTVEYWVCGLQ